MSTPSLNLTAYNAIDIYFNAEASPDDFQSAFDVNAVVVDEMQQYVGIKSILEWRDASRQKYQYTSRPIEITQVANKTIVKSIVEGNFPGSPVSLSYEFYIANDKIEKLEILG
ncbi:hypothetical protein [Vibrio sp. MEBiC08052]|uniref:hypothetical protein n=1 Tax=Vibrio sp. MEBiC08052 TaxID=1761910 RepID=UPI0007406CA1|nr:hypothetical protein [Vibrio sp. MEBiC08052]KUI98201.1 hypothetical protein VRK_29020 [Vibrio sp. MEBiC08052]